jgi:hypothetical protein
MSNSFKNLQNKLDKLREKITPDEPKRRAEALRYISSVMQLVRDSYLEESVDDYTFLQSLELAVEEVDYFGGFTAIVKKSLRIIEKRYNYIHEKSSSDTE